MSWGDIGNALFGGMARYGDILALVQNSVWAGAVLGQVLPRSVAPDRIRWLARHGWYSTFDPAGPETLTELQHEIRDSVSMLKQDSFGTRTPESAAAAAADAHECGERLSLSTWM